MLQIPFLSLCILLFSTTSLSAQNSPEQIADSFFVAYKNLGPSQAVDYLFSTNNYSSEKTKGIENIKDQFTEFSPSFGKYTGYELISSKNVGKDFVILTYIVKHDRLPLFFRLTFYKPSDKWKIQDFIFNTQMDKVLDK
jgi:hypothetical protein